jgi:hypothetical protein
VAPIRTAPRHGGYRSPLGTTLVVATEEGRRVLQDQKAMCSGFVGAVADLQLGFEW